MNFSIILILVLMLSTLTILVAGIVSMIAGAETSKKYGTRLMMARVISQALAIFALVFLFATN